MTREQQEQPTRRPSAVHAAREDAEIQRLLDALARGLTSGDVRAVADLWEPPALVVGDDGVHAVRSRAEIEAFFTGAKDQYNARGITDTRADILRLDWATDRIALVTVRWPHIDKNGTEVGEEASTYTLRRDDSGNLRIRVAMMRGEAARH